MKNRQFAIKILEENGYVKLTCNGNSMRPIMSPKDELHIFKVNHSILQKGDAVFCKINGNLQVHLISGIEGERFIISNNFGHVNGKISKQNIYGLCRRVNDKVLVSCEEIEKRTNA